MICQEKYSLFIIKIINCHHWYSDKQNPPVILKGYRSIIEPIYFQDEVNIWWLAYTEEKPTLLATTRNKNGN
jgi:hypothetical protein